MKPAGNTTITMPERIYARVHGASTDVISGQRGLIGGWNEHRRDGQTEFVRFDLVRPNLQQEVASAAGVHHGPFGYIVGHRDLKEDYWQLESDPVTDADVREGIFSVPLYALTDPFKEIGIEGPANAAAPAARELALEDHLQAIEQQLAVNLGYFHDEKRFLLETLQAHITTRIAAIRALSSPDHADAGKVEVDGKKWPMREIVAKAIAYHSVGDPHAKTIRGDQRWEWFVEEADKFISVFGYYMPALPSAPSQEVAE